MTNQSTAVKLVCQGPKHVGAVTSSIPTANGRLLSVEGSTAHMVTVHKAEASYIVDSSTTTMGAVLRVVATSKGAAYAAMYDATNAQCGMEVWR